jgi:hypothetical protein
MLEMTAQHGSPLYIHCTLLQSPLGYNNQPKALVTGEGHRLENYSEIGKSTLEETVLQFEGNEKWIDHSVHNSSGALCESISETTSYCQVYSEGSRTLPTERRVESILKKSAINVVSR